MCVTYGGSGNDSATAFASATDAMSLYVNGIAVAATGTTGNYIGLSGTSQTVSIGRDRTSGTYATADYRDIKIFNRELTASEVAELARGNDLGFSEEWAGANGGIYTQDATPSGEWTAVNSVDSDEAGPVDGKSNVLRLTANAGPGLHYQYQSLFTFGKRYRIRFSYRIPSGQSNVDGIAVYVGSNNVTTIVAPSTKTLDTWVLVDTEFVASASANVDRLYMYMTDGTSRNFVDTGGDDYLDIAEMVITEIGTLADFRSERYDTSTNKLYDLSDNAFVGTGTSVSLTGREVPVYETGTWTPTITFGSGSTGITYSAQEGYYTRIGDVVHLEGNITLTATGTDTGTAKIEGLPFTARNTTDSGSTLVMGRASNMASLTSAFNGLINNNTTNATLYDWGAAGSTGLTEANFTATTQIRFSGTYQIQ